MIVTIKPVKKVQWSGFPDARYKNTKDYLTAFYNSKGTRITGLDAEDVEKFSKIFRQDLSEKAPFWDDYRIIMTNKPLKLDLDNPEDELKYKLLSVHYRVAKDGERNPKADYIIYDEQKEAETINKKAANKIKAYVLFEELTAEQKRDLLRLYPGFSKTTNISDKIVSARLFEQMESDYDKFVRLVEDKNRDMKVFLKDLVTFNILTKNKNAYKYGNDILGHDEESTIDHLNDPSNQSLKVALMKELREKASK